MLVESPTKPHRTPTPITGSSGLKFAAALALLIAFGTVTEQVYVTIALAAAVVGLFLAEHFATSRGIEFLCLIGVPVACLSAYALVLLIRDGGPDMTAGRILFAGLLLILTNITPAATAVVTVNIIFAVGCRFLGFPARNLYLNEAQ